MAIRIIDLETTGINATDHVVEVGSVDLLSDGGGGQALIPSNVKIGAAGASIDVPLGHKDDAWSFDEIDTIGVTISGAPRPDEIVIIAALADGGRPRPRVSKAGAVPPRSD